VLVVLRERTLVALDLERIGLVAQVVTAARADHHDCGVDQVQVQLEISNLMFFDLVIGVILREASFGRLGPFRLL